MEEHPFPSRVRLMAWAMEQELRPTDKLLLITIADSGSLDMSTLARKTCMSRSEVAGGLLALDEDGYLAEPGLVLSGRHAGAVHNA